METDNEERSEIEKAGKDLFDYAIDREDVKWLLAHLPWEADVNRNTVEYELQILKIISVGWSVSYYLENSAYKEPLSEIYWNEIRAFSGQLSETSGLIAGASIDYFQTLKDRLDQYVSALSEKTDANEPARIIGPEFAAVCGAADDIFTFMTGSKMFVHTIARVKEYLETVGAA